MFAMFGFMEVLVMCVVLCAIVAVLNHKAFSRIWESGQAQVGKIGEKVWESDPLAMYQKRLDDKEEEIRRTTNDLGLIKGSLETKARQVADGEREVANLDAQIKKALSSGDRALASRKALSLQREQEHLDTNKKLIENYTGGYETKCAAIKLAREEIGDCRQKIKDLGVEVKDSEADRHITEMFQKFNVSGGIDDGLNEVEDKIRAKIDNNRGMVQAAKDVGADGLEEINARQSDRQSKADAILAKYEENMKK